MRVLYKTIWPPALATAGFLPLAAAHAAARSSGDPVGAATTTAVLVLAGATAFTWWVRARDDVKARWAAATGMTPTANPGG
jgi:hypothetical protein